MKTHTTHLFSLLVAFLFALTAQAQTLIIPQVVDGGAWVTTIVVVNTGLGQAEVSLSFFQETAQGATQPWTPAFLESSVPTQNLFLPPEGTVFLHTPGTAATTTIGWGQVTEMDPLGSVVAYAIFTQRIPGRSDENGTAPAGAGGSRILIPFDNTDGDTSIAIANPTQSSETISVGTRNGAATANAQLPINLPAQGHTSFRFKDQFLSTAGQTGIAEFYCAGGTMSIIALKFHSAAFTTIPVYSVLGMPLLAF